MKQYGSIVLAQLPSEQVITTIAGLLHDVAKLYQIQNWDINNSVHLAGWILRNYKYDQLQSIVGCLQDPPEIRNERGEVEKIWRLTPDTVRAWLTAHLDKLCDARETEIHNEKTKKIEAEIQEVTPETQALIDDTVKKLKAENPIPKIPFEFKRLKLFNVAGMEIEAYSIEEARLKHREIIEEQLK